MTKNIEKNKEIVLDVAFNQDFTSVGVGATNGYQLYSLNNTDRLDLIHKQNDVEGVSIVQRLFSSSLVAIVSRSAPRKLKLCHFKKGTEICSYSYSGRVLAVRLSRQRLVVCLEESIYIHNIRDMRLLHTVRDTPTNTFGLLELSVSPESQSYLAYPGSSTSGELQIFDALNLHATTVISAHNGRLAALSFNSRGDMIATASVKGTVVRVFGIPDGHKIFEFRRGMARCVQMSSLTFSLDSQFLVSSSNTETVHVYRLQPMTSQLNESGEDSWFGYVRSAGSQLLPSSVTDILSQDRAVAWARLPPTPLISDDAPVKHYSSITRIRDEPHLVVVSSLGDLYFYNFDPEQGGECILKKSHNLAELAQNSNLSFLPPDGVTSYAATVSRHRDAVSRATPPNDSLPYQDPDELDDENPAALRLDDPAEFPPMVHVDS